MTAEQQRCVLVRRASPVATPVPMSLRCEPCFGRGHQRIKAPQFGLDEHHVRRVAICPCCHGTGLDWVTVATARYFDDSQPFDPSAKVLDVSDLVRDVAQRAGWA